MSAALSIYDIEAGLFSALAHPTRLQILELLRGGEACVCHIQAVLGQRQAYVSQQLMTLRDAGLVTSRKEGLGVYSRLSHPNLFTVLDEARRIARTQARGRPLAEVALTPPHGQCYCPQCASSPS